MRDVGLAVADDLVVSLDYTLRLEDGQVVDTSAADEGKPLEFVQGQGEIIPGLEQALYGMRVGDVKEVVVAPVDGYGEHDPEAFEMVERQIFPAQMDLEPGTSLRLRESSGEILEAFVVDVRPEGVLLDFNHPLAGETLYFQVKIAGLRAATEEELAHGHVHGPGHAH